MIKLRSRRTDTRDAPETVEHSSEASASALGVECL
jgi:hypothetical protein